MSRPLRHESRRRRRLGRELRGPRPGPPAARARRTALALTVCEERLAVHAGFAAPHIAAEMHKIAEDAETRARAFLADLPKAEVSLVHGRPTPCLLAAAAQHRADLIAVGSHEHSRAAAIALGSVASEILHRAPQSVLVARKDGGGFRSIVAGVDGSRSSLAALGVARDLARDIDAPLRVIAADAASRSTSTRSWTSGTPSGYRHIRSTPWSPPPNEADLVVVGSRGLHGLASLGSVSERVAPSRPLLRPRRPGRHSWNGWCCAERPASEHDPVEAVTECDERRPANADRADNRRLVRLIHLSIGAALATMALKTAAWLLTGSVGLLSDAAESGVNLVAALFALLVLHWAARPADEEHAYGHEKADYLAAGAEGAMIIVAAGVIGYAAIDAVAQPTRSERSWGRARRGGRCIGRESRCRPASRSAEGKRSRSIVLGWPIGRT